MTAVCAIDSSNVLIGGNGSVKWLDWEKETVLRQYLGHASEVNRLRYVRLPDSEVKGSYFLSTAVGDRLVNAWSVTHSLYLYDI